MKRQGVTLLEVLVAIFVMALGMIALLTLFPLGVLRMAQALQDDRVAQAGRQAQALAHIKDIRFDPTVMAAYRDPGYPAIPDDDAPSYPVLVDPVGWAVASGLTAQSWVGGATGTVRRVSLNSITSVNPSPLAQLTEGLRSFTLLDDILFDKTGVPDTAAGNFERDIRYSWAFLCKKPITRDTSFVAEVSVVIFAKRPMTAGVGLDLNETAFTSGVTFPAGTPTLIQLTIPNQIKSGDWIMDASLILFNNGAGITRGTVQGSMHRVVGVDVSGTTTALEIQPPLRPIPSFPGLTTTPRIVHMASVAEVMDLGVGRNP